VKISITNAQDLVPINRQHVRRAVQAAAGGRFDAQTLDIVFVDDATIRDVNHRFLKRDRVTDVIAFDYRGEVPPAGAAGEIVISAERAAVEARRRQVPVERELLLYVVHGVLHLVGYDDLDADDRRAMRREERRVLKTLTTTTQRARREGPAER